MTAELWTPQGHAAAGRPEPAQVRRLESLSAHAWPPLETASLGGWVLRATAGVTRRGNSAWPRAAHTLTVDQLTTATRVWYARRNLAPTIALSPAQAPVDLLDHLPGWEVGGETDVLEGPLRPAPPARRVQVASWPSPDWWTVAAETNPAHFGAGPAATAEAVLRRISRSSAYAVGYDGPTPVAAGRGVVEGRHLGVLSMATVPARRGGGFGRAVWLSLQEWAAGLGAQTVWVQVAPGNVAARALYAGLEPVYSYAYAVAPQATVSTGRADPGSRW